MRPGFSPYRTSPYSTGAPAGGGGDADLAAFITATGISDETQIGAVAAAVSSLKGGAGLWSKCPAIYPPVGGTAASHKFNLKDPRDLDEAYRLTFTGGFTHNSNGITGNGLDAIADSHWTNSDKYYGIYCYCLNSPGGIIAGQIGSKLMYLGLGIIFIRDANSAEYTSAQTGTSGGFSCQRLNDTHANVMWGSSPAVTVEYAGPELETSTVKFFSRSLGDIFSNANMGFMAISNGLTTAELNELHSIAVSFNTALGR